MSCAKSVSVLALPGFVYVFFRVSICVQEFCVRLSGFPVELTSLGKIIKMVDAHYYLVYETEGRMLPNG